MAVKVLTDFACNIPIAYGTNGLHEFHQGDVIADPKIAAELVKLGCQVAPIDDTDMVACPRCRTVFPSSAHTVDATITKVNASITYDYRHYQWAAGEIVPYPWFEAVLKQAGIPLQTIQATKCPQCSTVFYDHPSTENLRTRFARR